MINSQAALDNHFPEFMSTIAHCNWLRIVQAQTAIFVFLTVIVSGCATMSTGETIPDSNEVVIEVLYATDRKIDNPDGVTDFYGGQRGELRYGTCQVAINPQKNGISGNADEQLWGLDSENTSHGEAELRQIKELNPDTFTDYLSTRIAQAEDKSALVYIHGYAKAFEHAAKTTAKLTYELSYRGIPILYSWPAKGSRAAYTGDMASMDWSTPHLQQFLDRLSAIHEVETIHLIAHSLGNRGLLNALRGLINSNYPSKRWKFGEIVLIAPDVDKDIFERDIAPQITQINSRITLYVSSVDFPLFISRKLNLYPRVGDSSHKPLVYSGIETIDVSQTIGMQIGHTYFRKDPAVLSDLHFLINERQGADERPTLRAIDLPEGRYWQVR